MTSGSARARRRPCLAAGAPRLRDEPALLPDPGGDGADPPAGREHVVRRLPAPLLLPRTRPVHPTAVRDARGPARLLPPPRDSCPPRPGHARRLPRAHATPAPPPPG